MKIAFFLLPKSEVVWLNPQHTMRQAMERMEYHRYSAVPLIDKDGKYAGTITEGDLLWKIKSIPDFSKKHTEKIILADIAQNRQIKPVNINAEMVDLVDLAIMQNFVPVIDDFGIFIGIIRRKEILEYCADLLKRHS